MNAAEYRNRDALNKALDQYLDAMFQFVSECLDEPSIRETLRLPSGGDLREKMEVRDIATLIKGNWSRCFKAKFKIVDRDDIRYYDARSVTSLIIEGRNQVSHQRLRELDPEFTRAQLFLIAEILGKIKRRDAQRKVESIRDELLDDTAKQLEAASKAMKVEKAGYQKSIAKVEKHLAAAKENNEKLLKQRDDNATKLGEKTKELEKLSEQLLSVKLSKKESKKQFSSISKQLENVQAAHSTCEERLTSIETERDDYKKGLETASTELESVKVERSTFEERLTATSNELVSVQIKKNAYEKHLAVTQKLLTAVTISDQSVFPPFKTDSVVRILDRRGVNKQDYLLELLEQKQPTLIYVQSEEMADLLLERVVSEKSDAIEKHSEHTSEVEEMEILKRLESGELVAVVSDTTFSTLTSAHCVEHFVFCHLVPSLDKFFNQCEPAFTSGKNAYLHLVYNLEQDIDGLNQWLTQKYPDAEALGGLYRELRKLVETDGDLIKSENVYNEKVYSKLDMVKLGIETGLAIFEELQFLERNEIGVKVLPDPEKRGLDESKIHCGGEELKHGIADAQAFQLKQQIEQIWEGIQEKLDIGSEQMLYEGDVDETDFSISETGDDPQSTETVENDSTADNEDTESEQASKPARANAKVTVEQVREIRFRSAAGESNSELAEEDSEKKPEVKQSEFWQPIRDGEFGALFAGKPVPVRDDGWISKQIRGVEIILSFRKNRSYVSFLCTGENRIERRDEIIALFPETDYDYYPRESDKRAGFGFHVINKGKDHPEDWDEIREKLVNIGTDIYNKIDESDL